MSSKPARVSTTCPRRWTCCSERLTRDQGVADARSATSPPGLYPARTVPRNFSTSDFSRLFSDESDFAADSTWDEALPVWLAPCCTSMMLALTSLVPYAACCTLREILRVAAPCSSAADAIVEQISDIRAMVPLMPL